VVKPADRPESTVDIVFDNAEKAGYAVRYVHKYQRQQVSYYLEVATLSQMDDVSKPPTFEVRHEG
jgi:hypothetical protein